MDGGINSYTDKSWLAPRPRDCYIAVMGPTGAGKSSLISLCSRQDVTIGHHLNGCTQHVNLYSFAYNPYTTVHMIDTPGFDDTGRSDTEILKEIAHWLTESYAQKIRLNGIIYLHRISDNRMQGSAIKNLMMFKKLCGEDALKNVILATTMWDKVSEGEGAKRQAELEQTPNFWGWMQSKGSKIFRHLNDWESAMRLVEYLMSKNTTILELQQQMVDSKLTLDQTDAGKELQIELLKARQEFENQLREARKDMQEAVEKRDLEAIKIIKEQQDHLGDNIKRLQKDTEGLRISLKELYAEKVERIERERMATRETRKGRSGHISGYQSPTTVDSVLSDEANTGFPDSMTALPTTASDPGLPADADGLRADRTAGRTDFQNAANGGAIFSTGTNAPVNNTEDLLTKTNKSLILHPGKNAEDKKQFLSLCSDAAEGDCYVLEGLGRRQWKLPHSCEPGRWSKLIQLELGQWASWIAIYVDKSGGRQISKSPDFHAAYPKVWDKILDRETEVGPLEYISLGVNAHYFARFARGFCWSLPENMCFNVSEECQNIHRLALGKNDSYVLIRKDGSTYYDLKGQYGKLKQYLTVERGKSQAVALNLANGRHFVLIKKNGVAHFVLPAKIDFTKWASDNALKAARE